MYLTINKIGILGRLQNSLLLCFAVPQHKLFNEHLVSASGNPALVMRRKKHTEKEVPAHLISVVSVRLREGYTIREISLTKGTALRVTVLQGPHSSCSVTPHLHFFRWDPAGGQAGAAVETQHAHRVLGCHLLAAGSRQEDHQGGGDDGGELRHPARHQLHPEETNHQPLPHLCHPPLLEHPAEVQVQQSVTGGRSARLTLTRPNVSLQHQPDRSNAGAPPVLQFCS